ncbi:MAG TPA: helix-turn-helix domain-containing protein, partial [Candidatus Eisenbacteria bacterium]|nr:helix-turn-helix domain-containing protein [Candidatus Eisenbacteria bacterium]
RDRRGDILSLARFFLDHMNKEMGRSLLGFSPEAEQALLEYAWPGNVRELRNVVERAVLLCAGEHIDAPALPLEVLAPMSPKAGQLTYAGMETWSLGDWEKHAIAFALRICGGNKTKAAELLKISRQTLRTKIKEYGLGDAGEVD